MLATGKNVPCLDGRIQWQQLLVVLQYQIRDFFVPFLVNFLIIAFRPRRMPSAGRAASSTQNSTGGIWKRCRRRTRTGRWAKQATTTSRCSIRRRSSRRVGASRSGTRRTSCRTRRGRMRCTALKCRSRCLRVMCSASRRRSCLLARSEAVVHFCYMGTHA